MNDLINAIKIDVIVVMNIIYLKIFNQDFLKFILDNVISLFFYS